MNRLDAVNHVCAQVPNATYLEIGIAGGVTLHQVNAALRIGVDPDPQGRRLRAIARFGRLRRLRPRPTGTHVFRMPSDVFFADHSGIVERSRPDVVLVDGLHTYEQSYRDTLNSLRYLAPGGVIFLDDCDPQSAAAAAPTRTEAAATAGYTGAWNGDVFKTILRLRASHRDLAVCTLDCNRALGMVTRGATEQDLAMSEADIDALSYEDFARDRSRLLNLKPAEFLDEALARTRAN